MTEIASVAPSTPRSGPVDAATAPVTVAPPESVPVAPEPRAEATAADAPPAAQTRKALQAQIDRVLADADTSLRFRVDEEAERIVVSVLDRRGDVILQVPNEAALTLARRFARSGSLLEATA